jgi:hypothetical protein
MLKKHIDWLRWRLRVYRCRRIMWSQDDVAAISALCIYVAQQLREQRNIAEVFPQCEKCGSSFLWSNDGSAICGNVECGNLRKANP